MTIESPNKQWLSPGINRLDGRVILVRNPNPLVTVEIDCGFPVTGYLPAPQARDEHQSGQVGHRDDQGGWRPRDAGLRRLPIRTVDCMRPTQKKDAVEVGNAACFYELQDYWQPWMAHY